MGDAVLHLFPDTNVFIECRPLDQLDWSVLGEFDEIRLIVCRAVVSEIDDQKTYHPRARVRKRAQVTYSEFAKLAKSDGPEHWIVRQANPTVKLLLQPAARPSGELSDVLNYTKPDDEIVGYLHAYTQQHREADVRLLTHDAGPMMTAKSLGLTAIDVAADWLLAPEHSDTERENAQLKAELMKLRKTQPQFNIACLDEHGNATRNLALSQANYPPLTDDEIDDLIARLRLQHPISARFGSRESATRKMPGLAGMLDLEQIYHPVLDETIREYKREYANWLQQCSHKLSRMHETLQESVRQPTCWFSIQNVGTKPGESALVEFIAHGDILTCPPQWQPEGEAEMSERDRQANLTLNPPPKAPQGVWTPNVASLAAIVAKAQTVHDVLTASSDNFPFAARDVLLPPDASGRDPNTFYYKSGWSSVPGTSFQLTCEQWRHGRDAEDFDVEVHGEPKNDEFSGTIECVVHCSNLATPIRSFVNITVAVTTGDTKAHANEMIDQLRRSAGE